MRITLLAALLALSGCSTAIPLSEEDSVWVFYENRIQYCMSNRDGKAAPSPVCFPAKEVRPGLLSQ